MKKTVAGILLFIWVLSGMLATWFFYQNYATVADETMKNRIVQIQSFSKNTKEMLEKLPRIFSEAPATAAILILNQKSKLLGSLYEPTRINREDYDAILNTYKSTELKNFAYIHLPFTGGYSIWVVCKKNISLPQAFEFMLANNSKLILIPIVYVFALLLILMILWFEPTAKKLEIKDESNIPYVHEYHQSIDDKNYNVIANDKYISNKILLLMDMIEKNFSTSTIAFYSRESGKWKHVLEKTGNLSIKGDVAVENLPGEILHLSDNTWREPLLSHDKRLLFIPLHYRNLLFGLIRLQFTGLASGLDKPSLDKLIALCTRYSDSLFMQRVYDKAVADTETDFYNFPYFYFMIKEKLASAQNFAVVVFEIANLNRISPETTRSWAQDLILELNRAQLKPIVSARLDRAKFTLLYEIGFETAKEGKTNEDNNEPGAKVDLIKLDEVPEIIQNVTHKYFKHTANLTGGFFIRPTNFEDADSFMQRLDYLLINSAFSPYPSDFNGKFSTQQKAAV
jgi:hypothetical protein